MKPFANEPVLELRRRPAREALQEALAELDARKPDVALVDVRMPRLGGIDVARRAATVSPGTAVILYTGYGDRALLTEALDAGARGFVLKEAPLPDLVRAVELVAGGGTYVDPVLAGVFATPIVTDRLPALSQREREVLRLLAAGRSNPEIAEALVISRNTVYRHVNHIFTKLGVENRVEAATYAQRHGIA